MKKVLKNSKGQYFTITANNYHVPTYNLDQAATFEPARAAMVAEAYNRDHDDNMTPVDHSAEILERKERELI